MKCPVDGSVLKQVKRHRMDVEECPKCRGIWLSPLEFDQLEDKKFNADYLKGSILVSSVETSLPCPVCRAYLHEFKYRYHQLRLDHCPKQHGFWLDNSEDMRVLTIMIQRKNEAYRIVGAQTFWDRSIQNFRWHLYSKNPYLLSNKKTGQQKNLPPHIEARPPAKPVKSVTLPSTCPKCGGPINSMTVIQDSSHQYTCGYCDTYIKPI